MTNKAKTNFIKFKNLMKVMQLPGTTLDKKARDQMGEYAKNPDKYLLDVNEMYAWTTRRKK